LHRRKYSLDGLSNRQDSLSRHLVRHPFSVFPGSLQCCISFNHTCLPHKAYNERKFCREADIMSKEGHMPTPEALENLRRAEEGMKLAQQELLTYLDRPDRRFSAEEREENRRLLKRVSQSLEEYFQAFEQAC